MGQKYTTQSTSGYNASPPPDDGTQVASNLVTWASVKTKLADVLKTFGEAINTALVSALDLSARAISTPDTAVASDHWKTLQVTGTTTITLSSAASMGAGYEVGIFNAGTGVVTVTPGAASDTINGVSTSVTVSIKGTKIFRTNQALTGYNVVGGYDPQTVAASTSVVTPLVGTDTAADLVFKTNGTIRWQVQATQGILYPAVDNTYDLGAPSNRPAHVFTPIIDTGTTGSGALKTNNGTTVLTWANDLSIKPAGLLDLTTATSGQIGFPAAQNASAGVNVLDDYEEGTWTPSINSTSPSYSAQVGTYTKIGNRVFFEGAITLSNKGTGTFTAITGLPFSSSVSLAVTLNMLSTVTATVQEVGLTSGATILVRIKTGAATSPTGIALADIGNNTQFLVSGSYPV